MTPDVSAEQPTPRVDVLDLQDASYDELLTIVRQLERELAACEARAYEAAAKIAETSRFGDDIPPVIDRSEAWRASTELCQLIAAAIRSLAAAQRKEK